MKASTRSGRLPLRLARRALAVAAACLLPTSGACGQSSDAEAAAKRLAVSRSAHAVHEEYPDVPVLSPQQVMAAMKTDDVVLVDVRSPEERGVSMLPGAMSRAEFEAALADPDADLAKGRTVVAYCTIGFRSSAWAKQMAERGVPVFNLEGSILAWTHAAGPLVANGTPTRRLHVYGRRWNLAAPDYETVWRPPAG